MAGISGLLVDGVILQAEAGRGGGTNRLSCRWFSGESQIHQLKILNLNCCSLRSDAKKASFLALVNERNPDIICGSESHLDQSFYTSEIFPDTYNVFREDRTLGAWRRSFFEHKEAAVSSRRTIIRHRSRTDLD